MYINKQTLDLIKDILTEREGQHGSFADNSYNYTAIKESIDRLNPPSVLTPDDQMAYDMIVVKLARIKSNPKNKDHWLDIVGYSVLRLNDLLKEEYAKEDDKTDG